MFIIKNKVLADFWYKQDQIPVDFDANKDKYLWNTYTSTFTIGIKTSSILNSSEFRL